MSELEALREALRRAGGGIVATVFDSLAPRLIPPTVESSARSFNDPIWKLIELTSLEAAVVDLPLMQRMRRVRQLGLAYLVYPSAHHSRLEHSIGALQAAKLMYDALASTCKALQEKPRKTYQVLVRLAALLHDCGHPAFSHLGEKYLQTNYYTEFTGIKDVLYDAFPNPMAGTASKTGSSLRIGKPPPAAELLSVLFVLSPAMQTFLGSRALDTDTSLEESILIIAGLILGRSDKLKRDGQSFNFVQSIVSGDLDADKLDYVARDAYFAGLSVSADPDRLLSQLVTASLTKTAELPGASVKFGHPDPDAYHLLAIRPAGVSALEMFVMTRSYLFERVYGHHKIRAGEKYLERTLRSRLGFAEETGKWSVQRILSYLLGLAGDDAVLAEISSLDEDFKGEPRDAMLASQIAEMARAISSRRLPKRALALSPRMLLDFAKETRRISPSVFGSWNLAEAALTDLKNLDDFETELRNRADSGYPQTFVDWPQPNPIKEDPDIWVYDTVAPDKIIRLNQYFDVEQLSNAYRDVKRLTWIFAPPEKTTEVAVHASIMLAERFDMVVGPEALRRAKIVAKPFEAMMSSVEARSTEEQKKYIKNLLLASSEGAILYPVPGQFRAAFLDAVKGPEITKLADRLAAEFAQVKFERIYASQLTFALQIVSRLIIHARLSWCAAQFRDHVPRGNEKRFQEHLEQFLHSDADSLRSFTFTPHSGANGGATDLKFTPRAEGISKDVICELKSEQSEYDSMLPKHGGQAAHYSESQYAHVSILYCQFKSQSSDHLEDLVRIRQVGSAQHPGVVFCIGTKGFALPPSEAKQPSLALGTP